MTAPLTRIVFCPGYDKRPKSPAEPNYGIHGMEICFVYSKEDLAIVWTVYTGWFPCSVKYEWTPAGTKEHDLQDYRLARHSLLKLDEYDVGPQPSCDWLNGQPCYASSLGSSNLDALKDFVTFGTDAVWERLGYFWLKERELMERIRESHMFETGEPSP